MSNYTPEPARDRVVRWLAAKLGDAVNAMRGTDDDDSADAPECGR